MISPFNSKNTQRFLVKKNTENIYLRKVNPLKNGISRPKLDINPSSFTFQIGISSGKSQKGKSFDLNNSRQRSYQNRSLSEKYKSIPKFVLQDMIHKQWRTNLQIQHRKLLKIGGPQVLRQTPSYSKQIEVRENEDYYDQKQENCKKKKSSILNQRLSRNSNILLNSIGSVRQNNKRQIQARNSIETPNLDLKRQQSHQSSLSKKSAMKSSLSGFGLQKKLSKIRFSDNVDQNMLNSARAFYSKKQSDINEIKFPQQNLRYSSSASFSTNNLKNTFPEVIGFKGTTFKRVF